MLLTIALGFGLIFGSVACKESGSHDPSGAPKSSAPRVAPAASEIVGRAIAVDVGEKGFAPASITLKKGEAATLVFTRTTNSTCATEVVFPELNLKKELPLNKGVALVVPTDASRVLAFQCGMGMHQSKLVVQ